MKKLLYIFLTVLIVACSGEDSNDNNQSSCNGDNPVYLADNGITIKACDFASVGDTGVVNGVTYTVVDEAMLRNMVANEEDLTRLATTRVTDMSYMVGDDSNGNTDTFNQPIGNWDVSNVISMDYMFRLNVSFNQPIGSWDVSNVLTFRGMFQYSSFNQPIGSWDMSSATTLFEMFLGNDSFNHPIGDWDVSNVTDMYKVFTSASSFNQPIGSWDVSNVTSMYKMFGNATSFNQPIGGWDVSNVIYMQIMFFNASSFNKDLSSWSVDGVTNCYEFSDGATSWTLPQPNFTNCNP